MPTAQDDDLVMRLVETALAQPPEEREAYLHSACAGDPELLSQVRRYVESEQRMHGFLLDPLGPAAFSGHSFEEASEPAFELGDLLDGRFRIVREVAQGGMGIVYEAVDEKLSRRIAIKCAKAGFRKHLPPEVLHASEISHPNVCKIFEIHTASTRQGEIDFITMEFLEGESLTERLCHGPPPKQEARDIAQQLCAGLAEAHRNQVIHGDLKSNNIILTTSADGATRAVITDFGLAQRPAAAQGTLQSGALAGTPDYMAPELWKGGKASVASDIYALGVILYEIASGHKPFGPDVTRQDQSAEVQSARHASPSGSGLLACISHKRWADVAQALLPAASKLVSTPLRFADTVSERNAGTSADAAGKSACATSLHPNTCEKCGLEERIERKPPPAHHKWDRILARCLDPDPARRFGSVDEVAQALAPPRSRRWFLAAAAVVVAATASGVITYQRATAPLESVRLAVLPFEADADTAPVSEGLLVDLGDRLSHVKAGRAKFTLIPLSDARRNKVDRPAQARTILGATHSLSGTLRQENGRIFVRANLTDTRTGISLAEWPAEYPVSQLRNMPVALAGMVTETLRLPPLPAAPAVNAAAYPAWAEGVSLARGDPSGIGRALELLENAVKADPDSPLTHARLAEAQLLNYGLTSDDRWWNLARESLSNAEQRNPDVAAVRLVSGMINDAKGHYDQAQEDLLRAIEIEPMNGDLWRQLGTIYKHGNQPNKALDAFRKAIELQPDYFQNYRDLGAFHYDRYDFVEAVRQYKKMVEVAPGMSDAHFQLSRPYLNMGRYRDAEHELDVAIGLRETSDARHTLAVSLMYQDRDREAIPQYLRALQLGPGPRNKYLLYLNLGTSYRRSGDPVKARGSYLEARELARGELGKNPKNGYIRACLAYLSARLEDRPGAESYAAEALDPDFSSGDVNVLWMVALTYEALGERELTLKAIQDAPDPDWLLSRLNRFPDLADLQKNSRFKQLIASHHIQ